MKDRRLLVIFGIVLVDMLSFSLVLPLLPDYALKFGANPFVTGLIFSMYPLAQVVAAPILGRMSDIYGRKPILLLSIGGTVCALLMLGFSSALWMLFVSRLIDGITGGNISVAQAYMADVTSEEDRGKAFGLIGAAFGLGFILGPVSGGLLSGIGLHVPPFVAAGLAAVNLLLVAFVLKESLSAERRAEIAAAPAHGFNLHELATALALPRVGPILWLRIVTGFTFAVFEGGFTLWASHSLGLDARANGLVLGYVGILQVIIQVGLIGQLTKRFSDARLMVGASIVAGLALSVWGFVPNVWVLLAVMPFLSIGLAVTNTIVGSALTKAVYPDEVGGIIGLSTALGSLTRIPAPSVAGALLQTVGAWAPGLLAGVLTLGVVPYAYSKLIARPAPPLPPREPAA
ncbi:MAG: MFS transporter [Coriobacteriia bacterium]|nr:MFS transporter [Coriobacteriia bacterium]